MKWSKEVEELQNQYHLLSPRERQVAWLFAAGNTYRTAAQVLGISPNTVGTHLHMVYITLGIHSRDGLRFVLSVLDKGGLREQLGEGGQRRRRPSR